MTANRSGSPDRQQATLFEIETREELVAGSIVYESDLCTLYLGDCLEILPELDPADLLVTDPPFGIAYESAWTGRAIVGDETTDVAELAFHFAQLKRGRHVYAFWSPKVARPSIPGWADWTPLVWDKGAHGLGGHDPWGISHEEVLFTSGGWSAGELSGRGKMGTGRGDRAARIRRGSVLRVARLHGLANRRHPTEKPVPLLRDLVESSSRPGEVVLDPFAGVGSTLVAAIVEGRRAIGIELEENYCRIAIRRIKRAEEVARAAAEL